MQPAQRTDWYRRKLEQDREELNQLESEYQQRIKSLAEMEDNRKTRVADKVRQQQTSGGSPQSRTRGSTLGSASATGQSWSSVVKSGATAASSSGTSTTGTSSSRNEGNQSPMRGTKVEAKVTGNHKRQSSGGSSPVRGRGASPSRSSIQAGTVRKMQGSFNSSTSSTNVSSATTTKTTTKTSESRTRLNSRSITTVASKPVSLAPYPASAAPYSPIASTSASRNRIARSPSISPTISAIASTFSGPNNLSSGSRTSPTSSPKSSSTPITAAKPTAATTSYSAAASKATTPIITVTSPSSKTTLASSSGSTPRASAPQVRARSSPSIASKTVNSSTARSTTATTAKSGSTQSTTSSSSTATSNTTATSKRTITSPTPVRGRSTSPSRTPNSVSSITPPATSSSPVSVSHTSTKGKPTADSIIAITDSAKGGSAPVSQVSSPFSSQPRLSSAPITLETALLRGTRLEMRGQHLAHSQGEQVCIWDIPEQSCITIFSGHTAHVHTVALRTNHAVISASKEEILVWDAKTEKVFSYHPGCTALAAHPSMDQIAAAQKDGTIGILHPQSASPIKIIEGPGPKSSEISSLTWSSSTHLLVAQGNLVYLVDTISSKVEKTFTGHQGSILHIEAFFNDSPSSGPDPINRSTHFFSLCNDDEVICWGIDTGSITSKTRSRGKCSTLFILDDRHSNNALNTKLLLPILIDPEGITIIAANDSTDIKIEECDPEFDFAKIALIPVSTPVLLI